ncbi:VPS5 [Sanghuangporus sanghuang]
MAGFDDLLSSSRHPFEANPFANPFDKPRSSSPDPWSTFGQQEQEHEAYAAGFEEFQTSDESAHDVVEHEAHSPRKFHEHEGEELKDTRSPSETQSTDGVSEESETDALDRDLQNPGFRESISTDDHEIAEDVRARSHSPEKFAAGYDGSNPTVDAPLQSSTPKPSTPPPSTKVERTQPYSSPTPASAKQFVSPLESPGPGVVAAFSSLALGGENTCTGGWQDPPAEYTAPASQKSEDARRNESVELTSEAAKEGQPASREGSGARPFFSISVEDPQKVGDAIRPYILYTVHTKTNSPLFSKSSFSVLRRYSDFLWLYEMLCLNNPGVIVPPVPEKNPFGRFDNLFVQQRRLALEICIQKMASHPVLVKDLDFRLFLESDTFALDIKHRKTEMAQDRGGILSSIGQTLTGSKFLEVDDWFDKKKAYLDGLESQLKGLVKAIDSVSKQREELAIGTGEFSLSITELSESDLSKELCHSLSALGIAEKKAQNLQHTQAQEDTITLMTAVEEYSRIINSVRMAFASRVRCHSQWQNAESELRRVKQSYERARSQGRIPQERTGHALAQIAEAERRAVDAKHEFERCSRLVKTEFSRFEEERIDDFKKALESFLEGMIERQLELVRAWEGYQELLLKKVDVKPATQGSEENPVAASNSAS